MPDSNIFKAEGGRERRQWERFNLGECTISVHRKGFGALFEGGTNIARKVLDLSEGGAQIVVSRDIQIGSKVRVTLHLDKFQDGLDTEGTVRWVRKPNGKGEIRVGVEFTSLNDAARRKIQSMKGWFTSPQFIARRKEAMKKNPISFM